MRGEQARGMAQAEMDTGAPPTESSTIGMARTMTTKAVADNAARNAVGRWLRLVDTTPLLITILSSHLRHRRPMRKPLPGASQRR